MSKISRILWTGALLGALLSGNASRMPLPERKTFPITTEQIR